MKVVFHPEAYNEMLESARFYEARSEGLGADFLNAVEEVKRSIQQYHLVALLFGTLTIHPLPWVVVPEC